MNKEKSFYTTEKVNSLKKGLKYVGKLANKEVGSAAENFFIAAKQS